MELELCCILHLNNFYSQKCCHHDLGRGDLPKLSIILLNAIWINEKCCGMIWETYTHIHTHTHTYIYIIQFALHLIRVLYFVISPVVLVTIARYFYRCVGKHICLYVWFCVIVKCLWISEISDNIWLFTSPQSKWQFSNYKRTPVFLVRL